jgi:phosphomannomutase
VMVTASHNPPQDNGYKVYLGDGSQIVPPADAAIAAHIDAVGAWVDVPRSEEWERLDDSLLEAYVDDVAGLVGDGPRDLRWAYTPMHGVGGDVVASVVRRAGFPAAHVVTEQADPDPDFPTLAFPNPEEPGAMDLSLALAADVGADLVVANDPDADRCAVAVPGVDGWRVLRGDELGALLGDALLRRGVAGVYARSIVSSSLLGSLAASYGQPARETLTGFKWIGRVEGLAFGYEEAIGYCVAPHLVRDKDGVSALLRTLELAATLKAQGGSLAGRLDEIAREHDLHATDQLAVRMTDLSLIGRVMDRLRSTPPTTLGGLVVEEAEDLATGSGDLPPTDALRYRLAHRARVVVRPSGTEPKLKCYLEVVEPVGDDEPVTAARRRAEGRLAMLREDITRAAGL